MKPAGTQQSEHPELEVLALYAGRDLGLRARWRTARHVKRCADCEQQVSIFRAAQAELKREAEAQTLTGFEAVANWSRLEREMLGNIGVGVAAARCIDKVGHRHAWFSKGGFVAALVILFVAGWATHIPKEESARLAAVMGKFLGGQRVVQAGTILQTTPDGIEVQTQGATLTILHPRSAVVSLSGASAVEARYIDEETGQMTITNVYGQ